jgi:anti-sigma factor RsiW
LDAYVDESLPPEELALFEEHLHGCGECAREALSRLQMKRATRAAAASFAPSAEFRLRMEAQISKGSKPRLGKSWLPILVSACAVLVVVAVSTFVLLRPAAEQGVAELVDDHVATMASANPVDVISTDKHTVKPWFEGKLPFTFNLPELDNSPYILVGGKLVYFEHRPGAQLLYQLRKHRISVFLLRQEPGILPASSTTSTESKEGFSVESWTQANLRFVVISDAGPADVHALAELLRAAQAH